MTIVAVRREGAVRENRRAGELVVFEHVDLGYGTRRVLTGMNLTLAAGDHLAIVGPKGSGKTTLLKGLLGLIKPMGGQIRRKADLRFGYVPQRQFVAEVYPFTAAEIALMGLALSRHLRWIYVWAVGSECVATVAGLWASFRMDLPSGPAIVACSFVIFVAAWAAGKLRR